MIRVELNLNMLDRLGHETLVGKRICDALKDAGVPVFGVFALRGIERGSLLYTMENDLGGAAHTITWREDLEDDDEVFHRTAVAKGGVSVWRSGRHYSVAVHEDDDEL